VDIKVFEDVAGPYS